MDSETSKDIEYFITEKQAKVQYTQAEIHRTNIDKQSIRTGKKHFTAIRADAPPSFLVSNWCRMTVK